MICFDNKEIKIWTWYSIGNQCFDNDEKWWEDNRMEKIGSVTPTPGLNELLSNL